MAIKASEVSDYSVPDNISKFRTAVRAKSNDMVTRIKATKDVSFTYIVHISYLDQ